MRRVALFGQGMKPVFFAVFLVAVATANAQIQIELKLPRLQFISYEPVVATLNITNLAGRDIDLRDADGQAWFGFEVTGSEGQPIGPITTENTQPPLKIPAGQRVSQKINLNNLYPVHDFGTYHVRAHIYFSDLGKYSQGKAFEVTDAHPIWQQNVGLPDASSGPGERRTYSLMTNRFPDHKALYVRVADPDRNVVFATYSLGHAIDFDEPQVQIDQDNRLHVLHCSGPRTWSYSCVGLNGELISHSSYMETKSRPRLVRAETGMVAIHGGMLSMPETATTQTTLPKLSDRPDKKPNGQ